jgi:hypothetical protein
MQIINLGSPSQFVRVTRDDYDLASAINAFEAGEMDAPEILQLFQLLVDTGLAWVFQGSYGRLANQFLQMELIVPREVQVMGHLDH